MGRKGVRAISASSIEIDFRYRGVRCRERINIAPTPRGLNYAERLRGTIINEIALSVFDYHKTFPESARATTLTRDPSGLRTIGEALGRWLTAKKTEVEHSTYHGYENDVLNILMPKFGKTLFRDATRDLFEEWIRSYPGTVKRMNNLLAPLRGMFAAEKVTVLDGIQVKRPREADPVDPIDPFAPDELALILGKCSNPQFRNLVQFAAWSGLRTSELIALEWKDVDLKGKVVRVRAAFVLGERKATKTIAGKRDVDLLAPALAALEAQREFTQLKAGAVFENPKTGRPWDTDKQIRVWNWKPILKAAGVRYRQPKQLRHTFASTMLSAGENVFWVAKQMGHRDPSVTMRVYTRFIRSILPDAGKLAEAMWKC